MQNIVDEADRCVLRHMQVAHPAWLVMWSPYHQTFTAFGCFAPVPLILDEADVDQLATLMCQEELRYGYAAYSPIVGTPGALG